MAVNRTSLISVIRPLPHSTVMIYDVHASESGALSILDDLYSQIRNYPDKTIRWVFIVSVPKYEQTENIIVRRFPWVKKNWGYRAWFDTAVTRSLLREYKPDQVFSLQNKGISFYHKRQSVYLHLPFILTDHRFRIKTDGKKLWLYQNVLSKSIFRSLRKVDRTIVQTQWMRDALVEKAGVDKDRIEVILPDISNNNIGVFQDTPDNRKRFFYPATAFWYKNHMTLLKALAYAMEQGLKDYEMIFTIKPDENNYTKQLFQYAEKYSLNVSFGGSFAREKVFELYTRSILVFPSYVESFGLPLLEAKMTGTYVIASDCPFSREILEGYEKAILVPEMDHKKMGARILAMAKNTETSRKTGK